MLLLPLLLEEHRGRPGHVLRRVHERRGARGGAVEAVDARGGVSGGGGGGGGGRSSSSGGGLGLLGRRRRRRRRAAANADARGAEPVPRRGLVEADAGGVEDGGARFAADEVSLFFFFFFVKKKPR